MSSGRIDIPKWAEVILADQQCPFCKPQYTLDDVSASGNRRKDGELYYFYEIECARCHNPAMSLVKSCPGFDSAQLAVTLMEFAKAKLEGSDAVRGAEHSEAKADRITDADVHAVREILRTSSSHLDFLTKIGMSQRDISRFAKPRKK